jgi:RecA/RadA recombinase
MNPEVKDEEAISNQLSVKASAFSKQLERVKGRMTQKMVTVYGLNHLRDNPMAMFGPKETEKGGKALQQFSDIRLRQTSRALSAAPFSPKPGKKTYDEQERSAEFDSRLDTYRYIHVKAIKNKMWTPQREVFMRIWVEDGQGQARGMDPVFDTIYYLKETGQISGKRSAFKLKLEGMEQPKKTLTWDMLKKWILGSKEDMVKISNDLGFKPMSIRAFCFKQIKDGVGEDLYVATKQSAAPADDSDDE